MNNLDYIGRLVDVAAFQGFSATNEVQLRPTLADEGQSGVAITGIAKLAQRFLLELFTEKGSLPFAPERGSSFMQEARLGFIRTPTDLTSAYTRAMLDIRTALTEDILDSDPLDERFEDAVLDHVVFSPGEAELFVELSSQDPEVRMILPVPFAF